METRTPEEIERDRARGCDQQAGPTDPKLIYYGPHECYECGARICRVSLTQGGEKFDYPSEPIYPNSPWHPHECDPTKTKNYKRFIVPA